MSSFNEGNFELENALGISTCESNFIASRIANTDSLIRQIKESSEENERLKNRIAVLKTSAIQVKSLYEEELEKNILIISTNKEYYEQIQQLQSRCSALENDKSSNDFNQKENLADLEKNLECITNKYNSMCIDVVNWGMLLKENDIFPSNNEAKFKEAKYHVQTLCTVPKELTDKINKFVKNAHRSKVRRKETKESTINTDPIVFESPVKSLFDDDTITSDSGRESNNGSMSTDYEDLTFGPSTTIEVNTPKSPRMVDVSVNTEEMGNFHVKPIMITCSTNTDPLENEKVYVEKATMMHLPSLVTRATSTSCFIKYADFGVNFPEHVPKSVEEILHEMVVELPDLVSPIHDFSDSEDVVMSQNNVPIEDEIMSQSSLGNDIISVDNFKSFQADLNLETTEMSTQTDVEEIAEKATMMHLPSLVTRATSTSCFIKYADVGVNCSEHEVTTQLDVEEIEKEFNTIGTNTTLKNVRKKIDYCRKITRNPNFLQNDLCIKKEEVLSPAVSIQNLASFQESERVNPHVANYWGLLGEFIFKLMATGKMCDEQSLYLLIEKINMIRDLMANDDQIEDYEFLKEKQYEKQTSSRPNDNVPTIIENSRTNNEFSSVNISDSTIINSSLSDLDEDGFLGFDDTEIDGFRNEIILKNTCCEMLPEIYVEKSRNIQDLSPIKNNLDQCMLQVKQKEFSSKGTDSDDDFLSIAENFVEITPNRVINLNQMTFVSPTKYQETNSLAKAQFKTPEPVRRSRRRQQHSSSEEDNLLIDDCSESPPSKAIDIDIDALPFVSPIKLKETNSLVKDQFKTPEPIRRSKRRQQLGVMLTPDTKKPKNEQHEQEFLAKIEEIKQFYYLPVLLEEIGEIDIRMCHLDSVVADSPDEPEPFEEDTISIPKVIPSLHVSSCQQNDRTKKYANSVLNREIEKYSTNSRAQVISKFHQSESEMDEKIEELQNIVHNYVISPWTFAKTTHFCTQIQAFTIEPKMISLAILKCVIAYKDLTPSMQFSPPAPALPETHQKLVLLVKKLGKIIYGLERVMFRELEEKMFTLKAESPDVTDLSCYTFFYVGLADTDPSICSTMRLFVYKCLYYYKFKCIPLIFIVLKAYPWLLPKQNCEHYDNSEAIISTLKCILVNLPFHDEKKVVQRESSSDDYNKKRLLYLLLNYYGYKLGSPSYSDLVENLVEKIKTNKIVNISYAFILLAKRHYFEWADQNLITPHIRPLLNEFINEINRNSDFDERTIACITTLSALLKTQTNCEQVPYAMQIFTTLMTTTSKPAIQEAAVEGLLRLQRFGSPEIYERLCKWNPPYEISTKIKLMLKSFVHRKNLEFWRKLKRSIS